MLPPGTEMPPREPRPDVPPAPSGFSTIPDPVPPAPAEPLGPELPLPPDEPEPFEPVALEVEPEVPPLGLHVAPPAAPLPPAGPPRPPPVPPSPPRGREIGTIGEPHPPAPHPPGDDPRGCMTGRAIGPTVPAPPPRAGTGAPFSLGTPPKPPKPPPPLPLPDPPAPGAGHVGAAGGVHVPPVGGLPPPGGLPPLGGLPPPGGLPLGGEPPPPGGDEPSPLPAHGFGHAEFSSPIFTGGEPPATAPPPVVRSFQHTQSGTAHLPFAL
jgi:hypothetical protein